MPNTIIIDDVDMDMLDLVIRLIYTGAVFVCQSTIHAFTNALIRMKVGNVRFDKLPTGRLYKSTLTIDELFERQGLVETSAIARDIILRKHDQQISTYSSILYSHSEFVRLNWDQVVEGGIIEVPDGITMNGLCSAISLIVHGKVPCLPDDSFKAAVDFLMIDGWNPNFNTLFPRARATASQLLMVDDPFDKVNNIEHVNVFDLGIVFVHYFYYIHLLYS